MYMHVHIISNIKPGLIDVQGELDKSQSTGRFNTLLQAL